MRIFKAYLLGLSLAFIGCTNTSQPEKSAGSELSKPQQTDRTGNYVGCDYDKRDDGYDWVAVKVNQLSADEIEVKVRSRADKKKPTCTFDTKASKLNDSTYQAIESGNSILFSFKGDAVRISAKEQSGNPILNFYCSGGASLEGSYTKINEPLDANADPSIYSKVLMLQGIGFNIAISMTFSIGAKAPFDYSVWSASAAAFAISFFPQKNWEVDKSLKKSNRKVFS